MEAAQLDQPEALCSQGCPLYRISLGSKTKIDGYGTKWAQHCRLDRSQEAERLYTPLTSWQLRVLALLPGSLGDDLQGTLHIAAYLEDGGCVLLDGNTRIDYEALSYC